MQEDGWPLGLRPLNARVGLVRNRNFSGSVSFSTLLTDSPSPSTASSSDLDTEVAFFVSLFGCLNEEYNKDEICKINIMHLGFHMMSLFYSALKIFCHLSVQHYF